MRMDASKLNEITETVLLIHKIRLFCFSLPVSFKQNRIIAWLATLLQLALIRPLFAFSLCVWDLWLFKICVTMWNTLNSHIPLLLNTKLIYVRFIHRFQLCFHLCLLRSRDIILWLFFAFIIWCWECLIHSS